MTRTVAELPKEMEHGGFFVHGDGFGFARQFSWRFLKRIWALLYQGPLPNRRIIQEYMLACTICVHRSTDPPDAPPSRVRYARRPPAIHLVSFVARPAAGFSLHASAVTASHLSLASHLPVDACKAMFCLSTRNNSSFMGHC